MSAFITTHCQQGIAQGPTGEQGRVVPDLSPQEKSPVRREEKKLGASTGTQKWVARAKRPRGAK